MSNKKKAHINDPHAAREAAKYENPIPSREVILDVLEKSGGPLSHRILCKELKLDDEAHVEALRRRLIAMVRDGQLISNRKGAFGRIDKMDLVKGRVLAHRDGFGFVSPHDGGGDIYLSNRQMRKVFDGDEVLVRKGEANFRGQMEGAIVEVIQRNTTQLVGRFINDRGHCYLQPDNPKIHHDIFIDANETAGATSGQIVVVELQQQPGGRYKHPQGRVKEILGDHLAPGMEIDVAIRSHGVPHDWPDAVTEQAQKFGTEVSEADKQNRIDLRHLPFVTIDGEDARDFDDAVYCETKRSGGWRLFVAIADVSNYVAPESPLDVEAQRRGNSVYFPDFVVPMLPEALSNGLCSLNPLVDRLCMVCEITISASGKMSGYAFYEAVMHSQARLTYTQVGQMIAGQGELRNEFAAVVDHIDELYRLYQCLHAARSVRGAIDFETVETRIEFDETRKISQIVPVVRNDAHRLIEECMLAANVCAARFMEAHEIPSLYRVHEPPKQEKFELLQAYLAELGIHMPGREQVLPSDYQQVMAQTKGRVDAHLIQTVMLRSMNQAVYQPKNLGHFGLAYSGYTHFTSPIRRYPDLLVHRALRSVIRSNQKTTRVKRAEGAKPLSRSEIYPYTQASMEGFGDQCSVTERRADDATRDVISWLKCEYLQERVGETFVGVVSAVTSFGLFVELKDLYVDGLVHITSLPRDYYQYDAAKHRLVGDKSRQVYRLGDVLNVQVSRVSLDDRKIDFELLDSQPRKHKRKAKPAEHVSSVSQEGGDKAQESLRKPRKRPAKNASTDVAKNMAGEGVGEKPKKKSKRKSPKKSKLNASAGANSDTAPKKKRKVAKKKPAKKKPAKT